MAASNPPVNGVAYIVYVALQDMATPGSYKANPTLVSGDVKVSIDGGAFANIDTGGTLPAVTPAAGIAVKVTLSAAQMTGDNIFVQFIDQSSPKEWADWAFNIATVAAIWLTPTVAGRTLDVAATGSAGLDWANIDSPTTAQDLSGTTVTHTATERNAISDAILARNIGGGSSAGRVVMDALRFIRNKWVVAGTVLTVYAEDDTTIAWQATLTGTAGVDPITTMDPA